MITEQEQEKIQVLSDTELYKQAEELMRSIGRTLPPTQINGLLNVSLANTYKELEEFVEHQRQRTTWPSDARHVPDFYFKLSRKLQSLGSYLPAITQHRQEKLSQADEQTLKMLLAREFIQHLLAENAYMGTRRFADNRTESKDGRHHGGNRGSSTR